MASAVAECGADVTCERGDVGDDGGLRRGEGDAFADLEGADEGVGGAGKCASDFAVSGCGSENVEVVDEGRYLAV